MAIPSSHHLSYRMYRGELCRCPCGRQGLAGSQNETVAPALAYVSNLQGGEGRLSRRNPNVLTLYSPKTLVPSRIDSEERCQLSKLLIEHKESARVLMYITSIAGLLLTRLETDDPNLVMREFKGRFNFDPGQEEEISKAVRRGRTVGPLWLNAKDTTVFDMAPN